MPLSYRSKILCTVGLWLPKFNAYAITSELVNISFNFSYTGIMCYRKHLN